MGKQIKIDNVTRIEGHGEITIQLDDSGSVADARFHVVEFRGFERFMEGRMFWEAPLITPRICGVCSVSHHIASVKACDNLLGVEVPPAAHKLRELMHVGEFIGDHALHIFFLAGADLIFGPDAPPEKRNVIGIAREHPEIAQKAIGLRKLGQTIVETVGGRSVHPVTAIPGGVSKPLSHDDRHTLLAQARPAVDDARVGLDLILQALEEHRELMEVTNGFATNHTALTSNGDFMIYDGSVKVLGHDGATLADFAPSDYPQFIGEHAEDWTYMKFPYFKPLGYPEGSYRVGPLARLNICQRMGTTHADEALRGFKALTKGPVQETLRYHHARAINLLYACERTVQLLEDPSLSDAEVRTPAERHAGEGIGIVEAPRGLLVHHYVADDRGRLTKLNLIVATCHNNTAINASVKQAASAFIHDGEPSEGLLNRVEMAVRAYDPCLSCATHTIGGGMGLAIEIRDASGRLLHTVRRDEDGS